jgi:hypothetical protein
VCGCCAVWVVVTNNPKTVFFFGTIFAGIRHFGFKASLSRSGEWSALQKTSLLDIDRCLSVCLSVNVPPSEKSQPRLECACVWFPTCLLFNFCMCICVCMKLCVCLRVYEVVCVGVDTCVCVRVCVRAVRCRLCVSVCLSVCLSVSQSARSERGAVYGQVERCMGTDWRQ